MRANIKVEIAEPKAHGDYYRFSSERYDSIYIVKWAFIYNLKEKKKHKKIYMISKSFNLLKLHEINSDIFLN